MHRKGKGKVKGSKFIPDKRMDGGYHQKYCRRWVGVDHTKVKRVDGY